jgi:nitroimidazol reductase NimA-like FMN-containing flavoprotein (pyridoxamine 5'-phosphate oxidase superfamily)
MAGAHGAGCQADPTDGTTGRGDDDMGTVDGEATEGPGRAPVEAGSGATSTESDRTRLKRHPERGAHDRAAIDGIVDEALHCQPFVIPTIHARDGDVLYVHGSAASRMLRHLAGGAPLCVTITLLDGLVVGRSAFHHSMNYRSVVVLGTGREVTDPDEKARALDRIVEHVLPGRIGEVRDHLAKEVATTKVIALDLTEASAKVRTGDPIDEPEDHAVDVWAGVVPIAPAWGAPRPATDLRPGIEVPPSVLARTDADPAGP